MDPSQLGFGGGNDIKISTDATSGLRGLNYGGFGGLTFNSGLSGMSTNTALILGGAAVLVALLLVKR